MKGFFTMNKKRILSLILACVLASGTALFTSCNDNDDNGSKGAGKSDLNELLGIPEELSGNGETFDIFLGYNQFDSDFVVEEETGDTIKDIIYGRNLATEERFDIDLQFRKGDSSNNTASATIRSLIQGGDDTYEVFVNVQHVGIPLIYEDLFVDWKTSMPYANLDQPWWYQNVERDLNFSDKVYVTAGAYNFHCLKASGGLTFNKTLMDELGLEYPYELVREGKWTVDEFIKYNKAAQKDLNGDGAIDYENDRLGFAGWKYENVPALFVGMGGQPVSKDENDLPTLNINNERTFSILDKMIEVFTAGNGSWSNGKVYGVDGTMFKEGRLLFKGNTILGLPELRSLEDDFGIVPYPKLNEEQESYYARITNFSSLTYIPVTNAKLDLTSAVLEYMAYLSDRDLIPAYYDVILTVRTTRDTESEEMIDIIRKNARFLDENYLGSNTLISITESGQNTLSSNYASFGDSWNEKLNEIVAFWSK